MVTPGESGLSGTSRSSDSPNGMHRRIRTKVQQGRAGQSIDRSGRLVGMHSIYRLLSGVLA
jgi:hypothetical protein